MRPPPNERDLVKRAQQGDKDAVATLYEAYAQPIYQYIRYRVDTDEMAEDLTADVFLRMVRKLREYTYTGAPLGAWLFRIASNRIADHYRESKKVTFSELGDTLVSNEVDPLEELVNEEERSRLREALQTLSDDYQNVLILRFMQNLAHAEVANIMEKSESAVRVTQHRALKALANALSTSGSTANRGGGNHGT